jgi:hypothetical protein
MSHAVPNVLAGPSGVRRQPPVAKLKAERVQVSLAAMGWKADPEVRTFGRAVSFRAARVAGAYAAYVSALADQAGQPCSVIRTGRKVTITLHSRPAKGRESGWTPAVLEFARRLAA